MSTTLTAQQFQMPPWMPQPQPWHLPPTTPLFPQPPFRNLPPQQQLLPPPTPPAPQMMIQQPNEQMNDYRRSPDIDDGRNVPRDRDDEVVPPSPESTDRRIDNASDVEEILEEFNDGPFSAAHSSDLLQAAQNIGGTTLVDIELFTRMVLRARRQLRRSRRSINRCLDYTDRYVNLQVEAEEIARREQRQRRLN